MARTKGSGKKEDEPILREAFRASRDGSFRSERAAALEYGKRLPGDARINGDRLYKKLRKRRAELEAEIAAIENDDGWDDDGLAQLVTELAGEAPEVKVKRLTRLFRILLENSRVVDEVVSNLRGDGLVLSKDLMAMLLKIHLHTVIHERDMAEYDKKVSERKPKKTSNFRRF